MAKRNSGTSSRSTKNITLVVGDWSGDGHSITKTIDIKTNVTTGELLEAYQAGVKKIGIDLSKQICSEYGDFRISYDQFLKLIAFSELYDVFSEECEEEIKAIKTQEDFTESDCNYLDYEKYAKLYLGVAKVGNPTIKYKFATKTQRINIGGYGLFS